MKTLTHIRTFITKFESALYRILPWAIQMRAVLNSYIVLIILLHLPWIRTASVA
jgi:hypothetical protein